MPESQHFFYRNFLDITGISLNESGEPGKGTRFLDGDAKRDVPVLKMNEKKWVVRGRYTGRSPGKKTKITCMSAEGYAKSARKILNYSKGDLC